MSLGYRREERARAAAQATQAVPDPMIHENLKKAGVQNTNGFDALFTTAVTLIDELSQAGREGRFRQALATYTHPHVLVIDEVGYLSYGPDAANVLFHVVNDRHLRKRPMIFTTNKHHEAWGDVLNDPDLAAAIVDRALERGRFITLDGPSIRTRHLALDQADNQVLKPARISGKTPAEFPEPTPAEGPPPPGNCAADHRQARHDARISARRLGTRRASY
jgi:hypothetical protein